MILVYEKAKNTPFDSLHYSARWIFLLSDDDTGYRHYHYYRKYYYPHWSGRWNCWGIVVLSFDIKLL
jgi:hypothetical protein